MSQAILNWFYSFFLIMCRKHAVSDWVIHCRSKTNTQISLYMYVLPSKPLTVCFYTTRMYCSWFWFVRANDFIVQFLKSIIDPYIFACIIILKATYLYCRGPGVFYSILCMFVEAVIYCKTIILLFFREIMLIYMTLQE